MEIKRPSIFMSALRAFLSMLGGGIGIVLGLFVIGMAIAAFSKAQRVTDKTECVIIADADGNRERLPDFAPAILKVNIHGLIGSKKLNAQTIESQLLDSRIGLLKNDRVKAILLHIDSPGGTVTDSYQIYAKLLDYKTRYKVPIYAYVNGICASGGMMIACAADKIFSSPVAVIGSVGVRMGPVFNFADLIEKYGIKQKTFTLGKDKDVLNSFRPWKPDEGQSIQDMLEYTYNLFLDVVVSARPKMNKNQLINVYGAEIFDPVRARQYGYIDDAKSSYSHALSELVKAAGITEKYQVVALKMLYPMFSPFVDNQSSLFSGKVRHEIALTNELPAELMNRPLYLYLPTASCAGS